MEVLKIKQLINGVSVVLVAGSIVWIVTTLIEVDKRTAITEVKVSENHKMLKPLWEEFIRRNTDGYVERLDEQTDFTLVMDGFTALSDQGIANRGAGLHKYRHLGGGQAAHFRDVIAVVFAHTDNLGRSNRTIIELHGGHC